MGIKQGHMKEESGRGNHGSRSQEKKKIVKTVFLKERNITCVLIAKAFVFNSRMVLYTLGEEVNKGEAKKNDHTNK